ncbi:MAG: hypothetical protein QOD77_1751 [Thermoplasmata archaeon]|nr:hypothetical protein [Thermoplasmata archaeon]
MLLTLALTPVSDGEICTAAPGCEFWDENYHEYILYNEDTYKIDVLIVPSASPFVLSDLTTVRKAVDGWENGIQALGPAWMTSNLDLRTYTLGVDVPTNEALTDPEIVVLVSEHDPVLLFGIGLQTPFGLCRATGPTHQHPGSSFVSAQVQCTQGGFMCLAINTNFLLGGSRQMYDLVAHEFGHCLGIGHVGDALDFDAKRVPMKDIMSYQYDASHVFCVSTLNIKALSAVYAHPSLLNQPGWQSAGTYVSMAPSAYSNWACPNV